jgi:hypothetical protein
MKINVKIQAISIPGLLKKLPIQTTTLKLITNWQSASAQSFKQVIYMDFQKERAHSCFKILSNEIHTAFLT